MYTEALQIRSTKDTVKSLKENMELDTDCVDSRGPQPHSDINGGNWIRTRGQKSL